MHSKTLEEWSHDHTFGQDQKKEGETRTLIVIFLTAVTMVVEIAAGLAYGSMALLADGLHMASQAGTHYEQVEKAAESVKIVTFLINRLTSAFSKKWAWLIPHA